MHLNYWVSIKIATLDNTILSAACSKFENGIWINNIAYTYKLVFELINFGVC